MKVVCISDTHSISQPSDLPDGDILIHAGDLSLAGEVHEIQHALAWLRKFPHKYKFVIGGNHDNALAEMGGLFDEQFRPYKDRTPLHYLCGSRAEVEVDGRKMTVFGSAAIPFNPIYRAGARAYMLDGTTARHWNLAPSCDILITHGAPFGVLDTNYGDLILRNYVDQIKPALHVFGHIHEGYGQAKVGDTQFVNAALLNGAYRPTNEPIVVEV
jgi:predicted phosphodiesterase